MATAIATSAVPTRSLPAAPLAWGFVVAEADELFGAGSVSVAAVATVAEAWVPFGTMLEGSGMRVVAFGVIVVGSGEVPGIVGAGTDAGVSLLGIGGASGVSEAGAGG